LSSVENDFMVQRRQKNPIAFGADAAKESSSGTSGFDKDGKSLKGSDEP